MTFNVEARTKPRDRMHALAAPMVVTYAPKGASKRKIITAFAGSLLDKNQK